MDNWKAHIKSTFEEIDSANNVSASELNSKWRIVEAGIAKKKNKILWIYSGGIAAALVCIILLALVNRNNSKIIQNIVQTKSEQKKIVKENQLYKKNNSEASKQEFLPFQKQLIKNTDTNTSEKIVTINPIQHKIDSNNTPIVTETITAKISTRTKKPKRNSVFLSNNSKKSSENKVAQNPKIKLSDLIDLDKNGRHANAQREDRNIIKH